MLLCASDRASSTTKVTTLSTRSTSVTRRYLSLSLKIHTSIYRLLVLVRYIAFTTTPRPPYQKVVSSTESYRTDRCCLFCCLLGVVIALVCVCVLVARNIAINSVAFQRHFFIALHTTTTHVSYHYNSLSTTTTPPAAARSAGVSCCNRWRCSSRPARSVSERFRNTSAIRCSYCSSCSKPLVALLLVRRCQQLCHLDARCSDRSVAQWWACLLIAHRPVC
jgi:hypothetical protein